MRVSEVFSSKCLCTRHSSHLRTGVATWVSSVVNIRVRVCACSGRHCGRDTCRHRWSLSPSSLRVPWPRPPYWSSPCSRSSQRSRRPKPRRALGRRCRKALAVEANLCLLLPLLLTLASPPLRLVPASQAHRFEAPRLPRNYGAAARMRSAHAVAHAAVKRPLQVFKSALLSRPRSVNGSVLCARVRQRCGSLLASGVAAL